LVSIRNLFCCAGHLFEPRVAPDRGEGRIDLEPAERENVRDLSSVIGTLGRACRTQA
jgi:hypothetical protein